MLSALRRLFRRSPPARANIPVDPNAVQVRAVGVARRNSVGFTGPTIDQVQMVAVEEANRAGIATNDPRIAKWLAQARADLKTMRALAAKTGKPATLTVGTRSWSIEVAHEG